MAPSTPHSAGAGDATASALYWLMAGVVRQLPRDVSRTAEATLRTLDRLGPMRLSQLATHEHVSQPTMTALVTRLERDSLVARHGDAADGRVVLVTLTAAGRRYVRQRQEIGTTLVAGLIAKLPADQAAALDGALPALQALRELVHKGTVLAVEGSQMPLDAAHRASGR